MVDLDAGPDPTRRPEVLAAYLGAQRWYAGNEPTAEGVSVVVADELDAGPAEPGATRPGAAGAARLHWLLVSSEGERYQLLLGSRPAGPRPEFLSQNERAVLVEDEGGFLYDAVCDPELALRFLAVCTDGAEKAARVRPITAEQSNTSLVYDDRIIVKVFRRVPPGENPDVTTTTALAEVGYGHVAAPVAAWRRDGTDLAFAQTFLAGATDGWKLAQTSLRDFLSSDRDDPADAGGDFAFEADRLGRVTAELHLAMRRVWSSDPARLARGDWERLVDGVAAGLPAAASVPWEGGLARLRAVASPGPAQRVHGDFHLGQAMRTDAGWYLLDFEGEPARPVEDRLRPASPLKDVAGILRSLDYAARAAVLEREGAGDAGTEEGKPATADEARGAAWERRNRAAFLHGYSAVGEASELGAPGASFDLVLAGYELEKALYELDYERAYRPAWARIPAGAVDRILGRLAGPPAGPADAD